MRRVGIIGSGHTGLAVAKALVERGCRPIILDVGEALDPRRQQIVERLGGLTTSQWNRADVEDIARNNTVFGNRPQRLAFGSDYVYAGRRDAAPMDVAEDGPRPTFARGGFSMVWGAAMLPADGCDIADWPLRPSDLAPYYERVLRDVPLSAVDDRLNRRFPLYKSDPEPIQLAPVVRSFLLDSLSTSKALRDRDDVLYGRARLAVRASDDATGAGCAYCGLCLSGCVYGAIHNADQDLARLRRADKIDYRPGHTVLRLDERDNEVEVTYETGRGERKIALFDRVFLAAGAINTTRLVLESRRLYNRDVVLKTTQGFVVPMLRLRGATFEWPNMNTLTGMFFEFKVPGVSDHWVHTQINAANELVMARLDYQPERGGWKDRMLKLAFNRLLIAMCNFHSDDTGAYVLTLRPGANGGNSVLAIRTHPSSTYPNAARKGARRLVRLMSTVGVLPLLPFRQGRDDKPWGWHFGGSLPMAAQPRGVFETDILGRPQGWSRVHAVDSSVFPSVPGTTIALLAMANARRIAETAELH